MKIICVDDEKLVLELTMYLCRELPEKPEVIGFTKAKEALEWLESNRADIALLDINIPDMNGLVLAEKIKELRKNISIIFLTGYSEHAVDAFKLHASGYLLKPVDKKSLAKEIEYAYRTLNNNQRKNIKIRTFGHFDVFVNGETVRFTRERSKELLAYLVDRNGSSVTRATAFSALYEDREYDRSMQKQFDVILRSMRQTLGKYGIEDILELDKGKMRVVPEKFDCDLYRFYNGDTEAINSYHGEYMNDYSWASTTEAAIDGY
ncbi:MAG: response regulator [Ruminococcus sp.]|nr:response regulator [Ruminococcus sp.]